jgi:two-component system, chemotaxis family, protein-glutamate methylesterase/glutaminase
MGEPARVFVIDPNPLARKALGEVLSARPELAFLGSAATPGIAARRCANLAPEVFVVDFETSGDNGLSALKTLKGAHPVPVVIYTSLDPQQLSRIASHPALAEKAILNKPELRLAEGIHRDGQALSDAIVRLALSHRMHRRDNAREDDSAAAAPGRRVERVPPGVDATQWVIAIGASTGGTQAVLRLLQSLPATAPGIVVVQHMPADFTKGFAHRLDESCHFNVREVAGGELIVPGTVLIANGSKHLEVTGAPGRLHAALHDGAKVSGHRPSVDVLFHSVAQCARAHAVGVLLTGMGEDGAEGLLEIRKAGGRTLAQDEHSSTVFGMPRAAYERSAVEELVPLPKIGSRIMALLK